MPLALTDEHQSLADVARSFAEAEQVRQQTRHAYGLESTAFTATWRRMRDLGWPGLHLPESMGGSGYGLPEAAVLLAELGSAVAPGPLLPAMIGSAIIDASADETTKSRLLPALAAGSQVAAYGPAALLRVDGDGRAFGTAGPILGGAWADLVILGAGQDLLLIPASDDQLCRLRSDALDPSLGTCRFELAGVRATVLARAAPGALAIARTLAAAEAAGGAQATLRMALEYAKTREQFGRIIGSFQAIKHHLADMLVESERAIAVAWDSARAGAARDAQSELAAAVAAGVGFTAYQHNAQANIQVHGGIGFTWEHDAHLYLRRALTLAAVFGPAVRSHDTVAALARSGCRRARALDLPPEAERYREAARGFARRYAATPEPERRRMMASAGYLVPHWPPPFGREAGPLEQLVIDRELAGIAVPELGITGWVALTLAQHGTPGQVERWVRPALDGDIVWCQLFSEPGAGSDAAAVRTKAVRADNGWLVSGQKVWTSGAAAAELGLATVRTDPSAPKHRGITMMAISMKAPGVTVRPLREITGGARFNEVFLDSVFVPDENVVGQVNEGWTVARATLGNERLTIGRTRSIQIDAWGLIGLLDQYAPQDAGLHREAGELIAADEALTAMNLRQAARAIAGAAPGPEGNVTKLLTALHAQRVTELAMRILGPAGATGPSGAEGAVIGDYLLSRGLSIAGGTAEITRNVIAERILGLPRDPMNG